MFKFTLISTILFITAFANIFIFIASWQRRKSKGGYYFSLGMLGITFWVLVSAFDYAAIAIPDKVFFAQLEAVFYNIAIILIVVYAAIYTGYENYLAKPAVRIFLVGVPLVNISIALTNRWHWLYWTGFSFSERGDNVLIYHHGPAFQAVTIVGYTLIALIFWGLLYRIYHATGRVKRQLLLLFTALLIPALSNLLYLFEIPGLEGIDWTSIFFSFSGLFILLAIYRTGFLDILPVARRVLVERMVSPILVFDHEQVLIDFNLSAAKLFDITQKALKQKADVVFREYPEIGALAEAYEEVQFPFQVSLPNGDKKIFNVDLSLLRNDNSKIYAYLLIFHDMSEEYRIRDLLSARLNEIKELNQSLSVAQETALEKTRKLARLEERERLGRDLHDSVNQSIHSIMLSAETLQALLAKDRVEDANHLAERIQESGLQALKEVRLLLYEMASPLKDENANFIELVEERLKTVEKRVGIDAELQVLNRDKLHCSRERIENMYWLTMEALNNALKYANASRVFIRLNCTEEHLVVEIHDNGCGFSPDKIQQGGIGMRTMRERAALLQGELDIESAPGQGTLVRFWTRIKE